ncbi:hypothetical protein J6590_106416, partial [Homalodisca vitripennis]
VRGTALAWFSSYFKERRQVVSICGHNSDEQTVDYGNYCYKLESKDPRLSFTQTGDQPDLDPSSSPGARHIGLDFSSALWLLLHRKQEKQLPFISDKNDLVGLSFGGVSCTLSGERKTAAELLLSNTMSGLQQSLTCIYRITSILAAIVNKNKELVICENENPYIGSMVTDIMTNVELSTTFYCIPSLPGGRGGATFLLLIWELEVSYRLTILSVEIKNQFHNNVT